MKKLTLISALAISLSLSACTLTSAGVKKGDERNFSRSFNDISVERVIEARLKRAEDFDLTDVNVEVTEGIVVLSGHALSPDAGQEAERIAWSAPHVDQVGNEIMIGGEENTGFVSGTKDSVLATTIRRRLITDRSVKSRNVNIETENGIVYLLGVARTTDELQRIAEIASTTKGTKEVISYIRVHEGGVPAVTDNYAALPQASIPQTAVPQAAIPFNAPAQNAVPSFLTETPSGLSQQIAPQAALPLANNAPIDPQAPYYRDPVTGERLNIDPATGTIPFRPQNPLGSSAASVTPLLEAPTAFPSDDHLGRFRTGSAGDTVSVIESAPYYIDPDTGQQIPVNFIR